MENQYGHEHTNPHHENGGRIILWKDFSFTTGKLVRIDGKPAGGCKWPEAGSKFHQQTGQSYLFLNWLLRTNPVEKKPKIVQNMHYSSKLNFWGIRGNDMYFK